MENTLQRITAVEHRVNDHDRRLENVETLQLQLIELNRQNAVMLENIETLRCDVGNIKKTINEFDDRFRAYELEPATKWNKAVWIVISILMSMVVGGIVGMLLRGIGIGG